MLENIGSIIVQLNSQYPLQDSKSYIYTRRSGASRHSMHLVALLMAAHALDPYLRAL